MDNLKGRYKKNEDLIKRIGKNVRKYRKAKGLTIVQLSYESGLGTTSLSQIELGKVNSNVTTIQILSDVLEVNPGQLFE